ncbi:hypothetical protein FDP41_010108 [Naegleria fowleri]|uniref:Uncharacterized protein n=1 Tax=Naegleria fowleri TaxID=5763 RepID=A0A6A5BEV7_NAEFO|nr:uncharacterized protein FDP41_010108 [Naegleria fowleri]KAF0971579.1 hypothetical protein FDP41_010108 [Naegleria fowleri]
MIMNQIPNSRTPISTHSGKTLGELIFDMLQLYVKFKATKVMMNEIFRILNDLFPDTCKLPSNVNTLLKRLLMYPSNIKRYTIAVIKYVNLPIIAVQNVDCSTSFFWSKSIETCISEMVDLIGLRNFKAHVMIYYA